MQTTRAPSPRYKRPTTRPRVELTADDDALLWAVYRHEIIDAHTLRRLFAERSAQHFSRRLKRLFDAELLERLGQQSEGMRRYLGGSRPIAYALAREGGRYLRREHGVPIAAERMRQRNRELRGQNIRHGVATSRFMVSLELASRQRDGLTFLSQHEIVPRQGDTQHITLPKTLQTTVDWHGYREHEGTRPDRVCGLRYGNREPGKEHAYFMVEIDQGTETITPGARKVRSRSFWRDSSILRKLVVYAHAFRNGAHRETFGIDAFRVLIVTSTGERVRRMQECYQEHLASGGGRVPPGLFLFTDWETLAAHQDDALAVPWERADEKVVSLET